jgi:hypothetical protein
MSQTHNRPSLAVPRPSSQKAQRRFAASKGLRDTLDTSYFFDAFVVPL